jgi:hypothetical protein
MVNAARKHSWAPWAWVGALFLYAVVLGVITNSDVVRMQPATPTSRASPIASAGPLTQRTGSSSGATATAASGAPASSAPSQTPAPRPFKFTSASALFTFYGLFAVLLFFCIYALVSGFGNPLRLAMGDDGHLSTSKFQFLVWTVVFAYSYVMLEAGHAFFSHELGAIGFIPQNVLIAMGLSVTTAVGANAITVSYVASGRLNKPATSASPAAAPLNPSDLLTGDDGNPDLTKMQMLLWTVIAACFYIYQAHHGMVAFAACDPAAASGDSNRCIFPDIDAALMVLMGLGQGAYLGAKIVNVDTPQLASINPTSGPGGTAVTLSGDDLGSDTGTILINGNANWDPAPLVWSDKSVSFTIPANAPTGAWATGTILEISAVTARRATTNLVKYTIQLPR